MALVIVCSTISRVRPVAIATRHVRCVGRKPDCRRFNDDEVSHGASSGVTAYNGAVWSSSELRPTPARWGAFRAYAGFEFLLRPSLPWSLKGRLQRYLRRLF